MNNKNDLIATFISLPAVAFAGVSSDPKRFGAVAYRSLRKKGWTLYPVNPKMQTIDGEVCYQSISEIPFPVRGVLSMVPAAETLTIARECKQRGIEYLWIQQKSESREALDYCNEQQIKVIASECILMHYPPVTSIHAFHRWLNRIFGRKH